MRSHLKLQAKFLSQFELDAVNSAARYLKITDKQFLRVAALRMVDQLVKEVEAQQAEAREQQQNAVGTHQQAESQGTDTAEPASGHTDSTQSLQQTSDVDSNQPTEA